MTYWRIVTLCASIILLAGCGGAMLQRSEDTAARTYLLEWPGERDPPAADQAGPTLLVSPMLAAPGFDRSDMAYMRQPHQLEYFARHRWVDAPARMLDPLVVRAAAETGLFRNVVEAGGGTRADLRLDSRLLHLRQACRLNPSELQLAVRISLVDIPSGRVMGTSTLSVDEPITERTAVAGVKSANRALQSLMSGLQHFLAAQVEAKSGRSD
jgi:cholesterol transport system auxiliary component